MGKTRLAIEIARAIHDEGNNRVVFVPLAAVQDAAFVAPAIAEALAVRSAPPSDLAKSLRIALGNRQLLLVLDAVAESTGAVIVDRAVQPLREQAERQARAHLGVDRWRRAYGSGRTVSIDALLKDIEEVRRHEDDYE